MTLHDACTSGTSQVFTVASLQQLKMECLIQSTRWLWSAIYDKVFECSEHSTNQNSLSAVSGLWPHGLTINTSTAGVQLEVVNHHPPYSPDLTPSDFHLLLHPKKFLSGQSQRLKNEEGDECHSGSNPDRLLWHRIQKLVQRYNKCLNSRGEHVDK